MLFGVPKTLLWEGKLENPTLVSYLANLQLHEFTTVKPAAPSRPLQYLSHWLPPPPVWVKINVYGSFCDATKTGGIGVIFRN